MLSKNLPHRERLNPDWPITIYRYDCWPLGSIPQSLWETAKLMQSLWNDMAQVFEKVREQDIEGLSKEDRKEIYSVLDLKPLRAIAQTYKGRLPSECYYAVVDRFQVTFREWRKSPKIKGPPRKQYELRKINLPLIFNQGKATTWLNEGAEHKSKGRQHVHAHSTLHLKNGQVKASAFIGRANGLSEIHEHTNNQYLNNGYFDVGINRERLNLHVALHRPLPEVGRIKRVTLCGKHERPFNWNWSLQVQVEHPPLPVLPVIDRVCGLDLGWRVMEDGIRLGMIVTSGGERIELRLPFSAENKNTRREQAFCEARGITYKKGLDWRDLNEWKQRIDVRKDACKEQLRALYPREGKDWPEEARSTLTGITKMGSRGLQRLFRLLAETDCEARDVLRAWEAWHQTEWIRYRGFETRLDRMKDDAYRQIANWIARNFDSVAWEDDLSLKQMAEAVTDQPALENAQQYRQMAGLYRLRLYLQQAMAKHGRVLEKCKAAYSTVTCAICGGKIEMSAALYLTCEQGHRQDTDINAAKNFLQALVFSSTDETRVEIPTQLQRYLRKLDASDGD